MDNLLVIYVDQLRRDALGCYDDPNISTPNIDRLAREGVRFTDACSTCPICVPHRYAVWENRGRVESWLLFDLERDPHQEHNLLLAAEVPVLAHELHRGLRELLRASGDDFPLPEGPTVVATADAVDAS